MDKVQLGADAEQLLNNVAFRRAQESIEATIIKQLKECPLDGKAATDRRRVELTLSLKMAEYYKAALREMITSGKVEVHRYEQKKKSMFSRSA